MTKIFIADTPEQISNFRLITLKHALRLEVLGMSRHGRSVYSIVKGEFGFKGDKKKVLAQLEDHIKHIESVKETKTCLLCGKDYLGMGALSRHTRDAETNKFIEICSECGTGEAMDDYNDSL